MRGLPNFEVLTDHRPLVGVFKKQLSLLENASLMRMREKIQEFTFEVVMSRQTLSLSLNLAR